MKSFYIELDDLEYEVRVDHYDPGQEPNRRGHPDNWDAGSGPELNLKDDIKVWGLDFVPSGPGSGNAQPAVIDRIDLKELIRRYAAHHGISDLSKAETALYDEVLEMVSHEEPDDYSLDDFDYSEDR